MEELQKYDFDINQPLSDPYDKDGIYNAYYLAYDKHKAQNVLISEYREPKYERIIAKHKRLSKLKEIKHPNIAEIFDIILDRENKKLFVILEWCKGGNLYDYEKSNITVDCDFAAKFLMDLVGGLEQIHKADELHRYVNMENVEFDEKGTPKLTFRCLYPKTYYLSPEDKQGNRSKESDVFSLGVLFYKILLGQTPFKGNSLDEQIKSVQEGAKFPKDDRQIFPLNLPIEIKNIITGMTMFKPQERYTDQIVIAECQKYLNKVKSPMIKAPNLPVSVMKKVFREDFIPIYTRLTSAEEHIILAIEPSKHEITKFHIYRSKSKTSLTNYYENTLSPYRKIQEEMEIAQIYESSIIEDEFLVIRTIYDNQGSLKFYLERSGSVLQKNTKILIESLIQKLQKCGEWHNYLTDESILIRRGNFFLNYPPFVTKEFLMKLKSSVLEVDFIAPEVKEGKVSDKADAWSVAVIKYYLDNEEFPKFDSDGKAILKNIINKNAEELKFYSNYLVKESYKRKGLFESEVKSKAPESRIEIRSSLHSPKKTPKPFVLPKEKKVPRKTFGEVLAEKFLHFQHLEKHWTKPIRIGLKCLIGLVLLIFLFYWNFFLINGELLAEHTLFESQVVEIRAFSTDPIPEIAYTLVTKTPSQTATFFYNNTLSVLRDDYRCVLNGYSVGSNVVEVLNSIGFTVYQIFGILLCILNILIFCFSLSKMDFPKVYFISRLEENDLNEIINWMFINMALASQISLFYLLYGSLFHLLLEPCLSKATLTAVEFLFKKWYFSFNIRYIWIYIGLVFSYLVIIFFIAKPHYVVRKGVKLGLVLLYLGGVCCRIMGGSGGYISSEKESILGKAGELLILILCVIYLVLDTVFGVCIMKKSEVSPNPEKINQVSDSSMSSLNQTEENFFPN